ncbi:antirestriction protein [Janthinobacterium sp. HLX7-2]|uniref:antirestriction protein n=1 Tax=Janthinobacterium sp. HLX7-2 TaxID=1259331 RepID=UPI003F26ED48
MQTTANVHLKHPLSDTPITATLVTSEVERMECLPRVAGFRCVLLENTVYDMLGRMSKDYNGGYWDFFTLSNGGFYMAPQTDSTFRLSCENMFEGEVSANTAGIIACAMAYSNLSFMNGGQCFGEAYYLLSAFIFQQSNAGMIRAALD